MVSTGQLRTVKDLISAAADTLEMNLTWEGNGLETRAIDAATSMPVVTVNPQFFRKNETSQLVGDASKAREILGWQPEASFEELIAMMVRADLKRLQA